MKANYVLFCLGLIIMTMLCPRVDAAITVLDDWHMGESDPGAVNGGYATNTLNSVGGDTLANQPAAGLYPIYTDNVSRQTTFSAGSTLSESYSGGQYAVGDVVPDLTDNFGMELWVYPTTASGGAVIAYDGNTGSSGWGIYQAGTNCYVLFGGVSFSTGSAVLATNAWTDLALVFSNGVATLYTNGVAGFTMTATPNNPSDNFLIGADNSGNEAFAGMVDEVRVFTFAVGQFNTNDLLVNLPLVVTTNADSGQGSLRAAMGAANPGSSTITFATNLSGATITLASTLPISTNLTIDASPLPGGLQISGNGAVQVFNVSSNVTVVLNSLTIVNGYDDFPNGYGGGIKNNGTLTLNQCTLSGDGAWADGGAIYNYAGTLTLNRCTLSQNNASSEGGGIFSDSGSTLTLNQCTLSGNTAEWGGGIFSWNSATVNQSTLSANSASQIGGGFYNAGTRATLNQCTLSGNSAGLGGDADNDQSLTITNSIVANLSVLRGSVMYGGSNIIQSVYNTGTITGPAPISAAPNLAPLGNYGGPTQTMPPLPGSPAIGAGSVADNTVATDQRGYPRIQNGLMDIGAVEDQYAPANNPPILKGPAWSAAGGTFKFTFTNSADNDFTALTSTNLAVPLRNWTVLGNAIQISPGQYEFTDPGATNSPQRFYRVVSP